MEQRIIKILTELRPEFDFTQPGINLIEEGMLDSFDIVHLVSELASTFEISIAVIDTLTEKFATVDAIKTLVVKNGAKE